MPQSEKGITNFTAGELDPKLRGRIDIAQYENSAKELSNVIVEWYGGATRTPGTKYVATVKDSDDDARLIPFTFSNIQAYVLEFGDEYMRVYKDGGQVQDGSAAYEITTPYGEEDVSSLRYAQTADIMYITSSSYEPQQLTRTADDAWTIADFAFKYGPLLDMNVTSTTITPSAATGAGITLTASASTFVAGHVGSIWKVNDGYVVIKTYSSATSVTADVLYGGNIGGTSAYVDWYEGAWSTYRGFPQFVTFYENRAVFACTTHQPNGLWMSKPFSYDNFETGSDDDDAISLKIASNQMNKIEFLMPGDFLSVGNAGGISRLWSGSGSSPITPSNANAKPILNTGAHDVEALQVGGNILFVQRGGTIMRNIIYNFSTDAYSDGDVTLTSRHITSSIIKEVSYQQVPHSVIWCVLEDGTIATCTFDINQKITAWTTQETDGSYKSIATIPNGTEDQTWVIVERSVAGSTVKYIEYFMPYEFDTKQESFFVHSGLTYEGIAADTISGLDHLEGETVSVLAEGNPHPDCVVTGGEITLNRDVYYANIGLPYTSTIETNVIEAGSAIGSSQGKYKKIFKLIVKFFKSVGCSVGHETLYPLPNAVPYDLFTGNKDVVFGAGFNKDITVKIEQSQPLPMTVIGVFPFMETND
jgi:hypothetical protein